VRIAFVSASAVDPALAASVRSLAHFRQDCRREGFAVDPAPAASVRSQRILSGSPS
jgi:hypothetical protein